MPVEIKLAYSEIEEVKKLFEEYTNMLVETDENFGAYLKIQNYDAEVEHLAEKYSPPDGRLYLAKVGGKAAACIGLRRLDETRCEMKRLYVRPEFRGRGLAGTLVQKVLADARELGYAHILLDTMPQLASAVRLYKSVGFYDIKCYNNNPMRNGVFLQMDL